MNGTGQTESGKSERLLSRREPATEEARLAVNLLRERGVLINSTGVYDNILKIRPPLVFSKENADLLLQKLREVLNKVQTNPNGG